MRALKVHKSVDKSIDKIMKLLDIKIDILRDANPSKVQPPWLSGLSSIIHIFALKLHKSTAALEVTLRRPNSLLIFFY